MMFVGGRGAGGDPLFRTHSRTHCVFFVFLGAEVLVVVWMRGGATCYMHTLVSFNYYYYKAM